MSLENLTTYEAFFYILGAIVLTSGAFGLVFASAVESKRIRTLSWSAIIVGALWTITMML
ncbi:MAG: hypothetical protein ACE3L7_33335 [Candidatus Pristimantibacillus sp.]